MSHSTKLLDHLIQVKNLSGAIKPAPFVLKNLKDSINGVPFQLLTPGMSGVLQQALQGIQQFIKMLGGMSQVGNFNGSTMQQTATGQVSQDQLNNAVGDATMLAGGLMTFITPQDQQDTQNLAANNSATA